VYFMFSVGGFVGLYMGLVAGATGNANLSMVFFATWAVLLGFGISRLTSQWMVSRGWNRRAAARKR
jgi:hypothetical protein